MFKIPSMQPKMIVNGCSVVLLATGAAWAGGGGQNMLLVVDPTNENMLRIANAYAQTRNIPDSNIVFYTPQSQTLPGFNNRFLYQYQGDALAQMVYSAISNRGLTNQIDYIGSLFSAQRMYVDGSYSNQTSVSFGLYQAFNVATGTTTNGQAASDTAFWTTGNPLYQGTDYAGSGMPETFAYTPNHNSAIHASQGYTFKSYAIPYHYYMAGEVGYTEQFGNTANQVIAQLQRSAAADGTKPQGTVYIEQNTNIRSTTRQYQWPAVTTMLTSSSYNVPVVQEIGLTPQNRTDVRGAVIGSAGAPMPNGSIYLPGSWADNLTSYGMDYGYYAQTKSVAWIAAGVGGTSGTVIEPSASSERFPNAAIHVFNADGSTLGEAYVKSVQDPTVLTFLGDQLAQPYADLPQIALNSAPANGSTVNGTVSLNASASLPANTRLATSIKEMELWVDGKLQQTNVSASTSFNLDTTTLSDGRHELRIVAINNAAAESQNQAIIDVNVNNHGQLVTANNGSNIAAAAVQVVTVPVNAVTNGATLSRVELRCLGRSLGQTTFATGNINLDVSRLAYGANLVTPVEVLSNGAEIAGVPITVIRSPNYAAGAIPTSMQGRTAGIKAEYYLNQGGATIAASNFTGKPDYVETVNRLEFQNSAAGTRLGQMTTPLVHPTTQVDNLAARYSGRFEVLPSQAGEFNFVLFQTNGSTQLSIDGQVLMGYSNLQGDSSNYDINKSIWLAQGEHSFELLVANQVISDANFDVCAMLRGPDGITRILNATPIDTWLNPASSSNPFAVYQVPEPSCLTLLGLGGIFTLGLRKLGSY